MKSLSACFIGMALVLVVSGCEKQSSNEKAPGEAKQAAMPLSPLKSSDINHIETRLAEIPDAYEHWRDINFSVDGRQVSYVAKKNGKEFMVAETAGGKKSLSPQYDEVSFLARSLNGLRFAFGGVKSRKKHLVLDNKELPEPYHEEVAPSSFSADGRFVACEVGGRHEEKWHIAIFDETKEVYRSPVFPETYMFPIFSPDSRLLVFILGDEKQKTKGYKRSIFFVDVSAGKVIKKQVYIDYNINKIIFSSDSSRAIYIMQNSDKKFLVLLDLGLDEERRVDLTDTAWAGDLVLSPDGTSVAYNASREGKQYLVVAPWEAPERVKVSRLYDAIRLLAMGPDRTPVTFYAMKAGKWHGVVGDREGPAKYNGVGDAPIVFSPDGLKIAYAARKGGEQTKIGLIGGKWMMVVSPTGKAGVVREGPSYDMIVSPVFSPDGRRIAYRARTGPMEKAKRFIVIADADTGKVIKEGPIGDEIWPPVWSADGKAVGYGARISRELWWKVEALY